MITVMDILDEVETSTAALNGEIVRRAFHGHCCEFIQNQDVFKRLLNQYIHILFTIHRYHIKENRSYSKLSQLDYHHWEEFQETALYLRKQIKRMWPCAACIWLYNPTNRRSRFPQLT